MKCLFNNEILGKILFLTHNYICEEVIQVFDNQIIECYD